MIREITDFLAGSKDPDYGIDGEIRELLLRASPAAMDRFLKKAEKADEIRGAATPRAPVAGPDTPGKRLRPAISRLTPWRTAGIRIEALSLQNAANRWVLEAFANIEVGLPFPMKGTHFDNGMEFINKPHLDWCLKRSIEPTRP
jgi:hypothetical protein